ncbi:MAG: hypothetical protein GY723_22710 [bacterium]|nr:hypothetical protein [bacterium]MCP5071340.1 hypothetical protein [bacterium]
MAALVFLGIGTFTLVCVVVGLRLLALARLTRALPEAAIGVGFLLIGSVGYMLEGAATWAARTGSPWVPWLYGSGLLATCTGCVCLATFTWRVFRPTAAGRGIWLVLTLIAYGGLAGHGLSSGFDHIGLNGAWAWLAFSGRLGCMIWAALESLRYFVRVRRQLRLGLGDPEVGRRCFWWGVGATAACGAFVRFAVGELSGQVDLMAPAAAIPTVTFGLIAAGAILRAFFVRGRVGQEIADPTVV